MDRPSSPDKPFSLHPDVLDLKDKARREGRATVWERFAAQQPQCGVCGADADIMVARNLARRVAAGAASHSDHGRDLVETCLAVGEAKRRALGLAAR